MSNSETILIIDDERAVRRVVRKFLERAGYNVEIASNAADGLDLVKRIVPDLIILDMRMKGMSGAGFLSRIMKNDDTLSHAVLVITGFSSMQSLFSDVEVDGFMTKPIEGEELLSEVRRILDKQKVHRRESRKKRIAMQQKKWILVADDDSWSRNILIREFEKAGFVVSAVQCATDAIGHAVEWGPDIVLAKDIMAEMNGSAIIPILSGMPKTAETPVLLFSEWGPSAPAMEDCSLDEIGSGSVIHRRTPVAVVETISALPL